MATPSQLHGSKTSELSLTPIFLSYLTFTPSASPTGSTFIIYPKSSDTLSHSPTPGGSSLDYCSNLHLDFLLLLLLPSVNFLSSSKHSCVPRLHTSFQDLQSPTLFDSCLFLQLHIPPVFPSLTSLQLHWTVCCSPSIPSQSYIQDLHNCLSLSPVSSDGKDCLQCRRPRFHPQVEKIPWRRKSLPTLDFLPREFHGQRSLAGCSPWGHKESDTTEPLMLSFWKALFPVSQDSPGYSALSSNITSSERSFQRIPSKILPTAVYPLTLFHCSPGQSSSPGPTFTYQCVCGDLPSQIEWRLYKGEP